MSKTRKTAPQRVKALNRPGFLEEHHDHIGRGCDLPATRTLTDRSIHAPRTGCAWVVSTEFWYDRANDCGCNRCTDTIGRKANARRARYDGRLAARRWADQP
jgi:hypothetical protein